MPQQSANAVFAAVANPERRRILDILKSGDRPAGELVAAFPSLPQPAVSRHLRILREANLVSVSAHARQRIYSLKPEKLREVDTWVSFYRHYWSSRLDALETHLDEGRERR